MTISGKTINSRNDMMALRMTPDAKSIAIFNREANYRHSSLQVYFADEPYKVGFVFKRKEAGQEDRISEIFDISPNGRYLAVCYHEVYGSRYGTRCYIWDIVQKTYLDNFIKPEMEYKSRLADGNAEGGNYLLSVQFLPDNDRLIIVTDMGEIFVWSISQKKQLWAISAAGHHANSVAYSNNFGLFAMSDEQNGRWRRGEIGQHLTSNGEIHYQQYGQWVASELLNLGHSFRLWNIYSGTLIREFDADDLVDDLVFSHDDKLIAGSMRDTAFIWDVNTGQLVDALPENTKPIAFTANDRYLIVIHEGKGIAQWDIEAKQWQQRYELSGLISSAQVSQSDKVVAISKTINDWQLHQIQLD